MAQVNPPAAPLVQFNITGLPAPVPFEGDTYKQCPREWIRSVRYWVTFKTLTDAQIAAAIPVLLKDGALTFYQGLQAGERDSIDHFEAAFLQHYHTEGTLPWINESAMWAYRQLPGQSVEQYLTEISKLGL